MRRVLLPRTLVMAAMLAIICARADATVIYQQPGNPAGGFYHSSWWDPDGSNYDEYVWDRFVLASNADIDSIGWRGAYDPAYGGDTPVVNFTVAIYGSIPGGSEPDVAHPPLVEYETGNNAGQTYAGVFGGVTMYDYRFTLPATFHTQAGVYYWVQIEGWQWGFPGWSIAKGTGGDGFHFRCQKLTNGPDTGVPPGCWFTLPSGDAAFKLLAAPSTGVEEESGTAEFALRGPSPNPSRGDRLEVSFRLVDAAPAELVLFDVGGRRVASREVGALGAGSHVVDMAADRPIEPGIYFARLSQGGRAQVIKVTVTR